MPMLGVVENMAGVTCPHCGGEFHLFPRDHLAAALSGVGVSSLAQIPLSPTLASGSDSGRPIVLDAPQSVEARAFAPAVDACIAHAREGFAAAAADSLRAMGQEATQSADLEEALAAVPAEQRASVRSELAALFGHPPPSPSDQDDSSR